MRRTWMLVSAGLLSVPVSALELAKYPLAFSGERGLQVQLAPSADGDQALLQVTGVNSPIDEVVFLTQVQDRGQKTLAFRTTYDGEQRALVVKREDWGREQYFLYLPGEGERSLVPDSDLANSVRPQALEALYKQQYSDGVHAELARFKRAVHQQDATAALAAKDAEAQQDCGSTVSTEVYWSQISDEQLQQLSIAGYCGEVVSQMASICRADADFKTKAATIQTVNCTFGDELKLRHEGGAMLFSTERNAPNQGDFINAYLRNL